MKEKRVKVIEDKHATWTLEITCRDCKSKLEITAKDVFSARYGSFDEFEIEWRVECGACQSEIKVSSKIPEWVKRESKERK